MPERSKVYRQEHVEQTRGADRGFVRSVDVSVPEGFAVSGGPITSSGTIAINHAPGYSLLTPDMKSAVDALLSMFHVDAQGNIIPLKPIKITKGLYLDPSDTTTQGANVHADLTTGKVQIVSGTGGGDSSGGVTVTLNKYSSTVGSSITATASVTGVMPTRYYFTAFEGNSIIAEFSGTNNTFSFTPTYAGQYHVAVVVEATTGGDLFGESGYCSVSGSAGGGNLTIQTYVSKTSASVGENVQFWATASGATGNVTWTYYVYNQNGMQSSGSGSSVTMPLPSIGNWYVEFVARDLVSEDARITPVCTVSSGGSGNPTYGIVTGSGVRMRARPSTTATTVLTFSSGTQVAITGQRVPDDDGGSIDWWPVRYFQDGDYFYGYIRSDYLQTN